MTMLFLKWIKSEPVNTFSTTKVEIKGLSLYIKMYLMQLKHLKFKKLRKHRSYENRMLAVNFTCLEAQDSYSSRAIVSQATMIFFQ